MENENITLNEASIFYKRIDKDTYLIGKDKDSYGQFLIEDAIAPLYSLRLMKSIGKR